MSDDDKVSTFLIQIENTQANTQRTGKRMFYSSFLSFGIDSTKYHSALHRINVQKLLTDTYREICSSTLWPKIGKDNPLELLRIREADFSEILY